MLRDSPLILLLTISTILVGYGSCVGLYTIVSPKYIRPNIDYNVSITVHDHQEPTTIRLSIEDGLTYKNAKEVTIDSNKTELITLHIDDLNVNKGYKFVAEGVSGIIFKEESRLNVESKNVSIFIQTDKAIYKPGETIKFRVLVLDYELKPVTLTKDKLLNVYLNDPEKNLIKQWLNLNPKMGVYSSEIQLSELPTLGQWQFTAQVQNEKRTQTVEVSEYVLPKFEVTIDTAKAFSAKDGKVRAIVRSKYTYGKLVKGEAVVSLTPKYNDFGYYRPSHSYTSDSIIKTVPINGKGTVEFDVDSELSLSDFNVNSYRKEYELRATVIEELTGQNQTTSKSIYIHPTRYRFDAKDLSHQYSPGIPLTFQITVSHHDDSPVLLNDETKWITIGKIINRHHDSENVTYYKFELNANGTADIRIPTYLKDQSFNLQIKYMGEESDLGYHYPLSVAEPSELEIKILNKRITLEKNVFCEVQSSYLLQNFTYQVVAHGKVIYAENVKVPNRNYHVFKFMATFDLVPEATIIVYRFYNGQFVSTSTSLQIEEDLNNFLKLKLSKNEVKPGSEVNIDVITKATSHVGLVGVDQSVLLLKSNEGLTREDAVAQMNDYQNHVHTVGEGPWSVANMRDYYTHSIYTFDRNNVIFFTNGIKKEKIYPVFEDRVYDSPVQFSSFAVHRKGFPMVQASYATTTSMHEMAAGSSAPDAAEPPKIRTEFPETWLWEDFDVNNTNGVETLTKKVPDTITSWVITGFSVNSKFGLGLTKNPKTLNVFQPFFVSLNLPYSVKRGEVVSIPVVLFNYLQSDVEAELTIHNENGDFEFIDDEKDAKSIRKRKLTVTSNNGVNVNFIVKFNTVGQIPIKVTATSAIAGDAIERLLLVEPEGIPQFINKAVFVDLRETQQFNAVQEIDVPENAIEGSLKINVNALGDLLGGTMKNLHQLIRLPTGCGEQNMLKFVPNVVVLDYLNVAGALEPTIETKAIKYLTSGYQRELTYRHRDGSFSSFGKWDRSGSTWLTAFVAKSFKQAEKYIDIDTKIVNASLGWLATIQAVNGSFSEYGSISHWDMQGGSAKGIALTAYTAIAFLRNKEGSKEWQHQATVDKAITYIAENVKDIDNTYAKSITAYALQLADHPKKDEVLDSLVASTITKEQHKWWVQSNKPGARQSKSINVEITSYGLLALIKAKRLAEALPYFKWLLAQRNDQGGFVGTQDTVIGLEALAKYAENLSTKDNNVQMNVKLDVPMNETFINVNKENALVLQTVELPSQTRNVQLSASGHGFALFQLSYRYNLLEKDIPPVFDLNVKVSDFKPGHLTVEVCSSYKEDKPSNMVILEVGMPSGFIIEKDKLSTLLYQSHVVSAGKMEFVTSQASYSVPQLPQPRVIEQNQPSTVPPVLVPLPTHERLVKLVETKRGETVAVIYFDQMPSNENVCIEVQGYRSHKVAENKPVAVRLYDYYDSSKSAKVFYEIPSISSCDICQGDECSKSCKN